MAIAQGPRKIFRASALKAVSGFRFPSSPALLAHQSFRLSCPAAYRANRRYVCGAPRPRPGALFKGVPPRRVDRSSAASLLCLLVGCKPASAPGFALLYLIKVWQLDIRLSGTPIGIRGRRFPVPKAEGVQVTQQEIKRVAIYCRVSTEDQGCDRQVRDLTAYAKRAGFEVIGSPYKETASGARSDRQERAKIIQLARTKQIDAVLVTELSRWGRSTEDLLFTLQQLADWGCSIIAQTGMDFDLRTAQGKLMLTIMAGFSQFERDLIRD